MNRRRVRMHKEFMRMDINFKKGTSINLFAAVLKKLNLKKELSHVEFNKKEVRAIGFRSCDHVEEDECRILEIEKTDTGIRILPKAEVMSLFFTGSELSLISKRKSKEDDETLRKKAKELMLFDKEELYCINGRYPKHLYLILSCFQKSGFYVNSLEKFKRIMGIPDRYTPYDIKKILNSCIDELKRKSSVKIESIKIECGGGSKMIKIKFDHCVDYENLTEEQVEMAKEIAKKNGINITHILKKPDSIVFKMTIRDLLTKNF